MDGVLFLIGVQELGAGKQTFTKEQKQDLIHVGVCTLLSQANYYTFLDFDEDGWPHFEYNREQPKLDNAQQEKLLKKMIIEYFKKGEAHFLPYLVEEKKKYSWDKQTETIFTIANCK